MTLNDDEVPNKQRTILWCLVFSGFSINYMIRCNLNIAIIDMVDQAHLKKTGVNTTSECFERTDEVERNSSSITTDHTSTNFTLTTNDVTPSSLSLERLLLAIDYERGFNWDSSVQGQVLGSFFYLHFLLQLSGGIWAAKYGTKLIFGMSNLLGCLLCSLMPLASYLDYRYLIVLRVIQGIVCSMAWPSMHVMSGRWIPKFERARFVSAYLGSSFGIAIFYPVFGFIMKSTNWENVFHFCSILGIIWWLFWQHFVFDSPAQHPRIHPSERKFIEDSLSSSFKLNEIEEECRTPWKEILTSRPLWINTIAQIGGIFGLFTLLTQAPTYFRTIHGWESTKIGILSGVPHLLRTFMAIVISQITDYLLRNDFLSRNNVRKIGAGIGTIGNGIFVLGLAFSGCDSTTACICIIIATGCHGAVSSGPLAAIIDISPRYAGILLGLVNIFCTLPGFISPIIVSYFTYQNQTTESWKIVFIITAAFLIVSGIIYVIFADNEMQSWNSGKARKIKNAEQETQLFNLKRKECEDQKGKMDVIY